MKGLLISYWCQLNWWGWTKFAKKQFISVFMVKDPKLFFSNYWLPYRYVYFLSFWQLLSKVAPFSFFPDNIPILLKILIFLIYVVRIQFVLDAADFLSFKEISRPLRQGYSTYIRTVFFLFSRVIHGDMWQTIFWHQAIIHSARRRLIIWHVTQTKTFDKESKEKPSLSFYSKFTKNAPNMVPVCYFYVGYTHEM